MEVSKDSRGTDRTLGTFTIPFRLPGLNEVVEANRRNKFAGAKMKADADNLVAHFASDMNPIEQYPCTVHITFVEENQKRDVDNVYSSGKFVLDGMRKAGRIKNDSPKYVKDVKYNVQYGDSSCVIVEVRT